MDEIEQEETANEVSGQEETANVEEIAEPGPPEPEQEQVEETEQAEEETASEPDPDGKDWEDTDDPVYLYETIYPVSDDGAITVVHEITLGDVIISTILIAILVFHVLDRLIRR